MKQISFTIIFLIGSLAFFSCERENISKPHTKALVANAGPDISVSLLKCSDKSTIIELDGSGSFDPDSNIVSYRWAAI